MFWDELHLYFTCVDLSLKDIVNQLHPPEIGAGGKGSWVLLDWRGGGGVGP